MAADGIGSPLTRETRLRDLAQRVWSIEGIRIDIFGHMSNKDRVRYLTLSKEVFPDVAKAIYRISNAKIMATISQLSANHPPRYAYATVVRHLDLGQGRKVIDDNQLTMAKLVDMFPNLRQLVYESLSFLIPCSPTQDVGLMFAMIPPSPNGMSSTVMTRRYIEAITNRLSLKTRAINRCMFSLAIRIVSQKSGGTIDHGHSIGAAPPFAVPTWLWRLEMKTLYSLQDVTTLLGMRCFTNGTRLAAAYVTCQHYTSARLNDFARQYASRLRALSLRAEEPLLQLGDAWSDVVWTDLLVLTDLDIDLGLEIPSMCALSEDYIETLPLTTPPIRKPLSKQKPLHLSTFAITIVVSSDILPDDLPTIRSCVPSPADLAEFMHGIGGPLCLYSVRLRLRKPYSATAEINWDAFGKELDIDVRREINVILARRTDRGWWKVEKGSSSGNGKKLSLLVADGVTSTLVAGDK